MFNVNLELQDDIATVEFSGNAAEMNAGIIPEVRKALDKNIRMILIDLSKVLFIDANAIQTIIETIHYAHRREGKVYLTDIPPAAQRLIALNLRGTILPVFSTKRDAMREIGFQRLENYSPPKMKILVIEGITPLSTELSRLFRETKLWYTYKLKATKDCIDAKVFVKEFQPSVILLDSSLNTDDAEFFINWLKGDILYWFIPVLVVTTDGMARKALELIQKGADDLIYFPFRTDELNTRLQFAIQMYNIVKRANEREAAGRDPQAI
jgi:anti-anti-sigma factor